MKRGATLYYSVTDHLGSTSLTLSTNGDVYTEQRYKPFGETAWSSLTETPTQRRYTGQIQDFDTVNMQLYFYNARYYDPELARFTQADTIVPEPGNPQTLNRFSYVNNNPINYVDPTGHFTEEAIIDYLKAEYNDDWQYYYDLWFANEAWWNMLLLAEAGDYLVLGLNDTAYAGTLVFYQFQGEGNTLLLGITPVETNSGLSPEMDLHHVFEGKIMQTSFSKNNFQTNTGLPGWMQYSPSKSRSFMWLGLLRPVGTTLEFCVRPGLSFASHRWSQSQTDFANLVPTIATPFVESKFGIPAGPAAISGIIAYYLQPQLNESFHIAENQVRLTFSGMGVTYRGWIRQGGAGSPWKFYVLGVDLTK